MDDPTDLLGQEREAEAERLQVRERRRRELDDLKWLMAHPQGRRITARLLARAGVDKTSFNHSGSVMAFNEGRRDMGLFIKAEVFEASPDGYFKILKEYASND